jgi:hypothetical protein
MTLPEKTKGTKRTTRMVYSSVMMGSRRGPPTNGEKSGDDSGSPKSFPCLTTHTSTPLLARASVNVGGNFEPPPKRDPTTLPKPPPPSINDDDDNKEEPFKEVKSFSAARTATLGHSIADDASFAASWSAAS